MTVEVVEILETQVQVVEILETEVEVVEVVEAAGPRGDTGMQGDAGEAGADGAPGSDGFPGADGAPGAPGADGAPGTDGAPGLPGVDGAPGADGVVGVDGTPGVDGVPGVPGADGTNGAPGTPGLDGAPGVDGVPGTDGVDGAPGSDGAPGADGLPGVDGADGVPGADGATGAAGPGVPAGGTTGQVLAKVSGTDLDTHWATPAAGSGLPVGGVDGQLLGVVASAPAWVAAPTGGGSNLADAFKGPWSATTLYAKGDVVKQAGTLFVAVSAQSGRDPAASPGPESVGSVLGTASAYWSNQVSTAFTVNVAVTISALTVYFTTTAGGLVGISSDFNNSGSVPWLGKANLPSATGEITVVLDNPVNLVPGTTYRVVFTSGGASRLSGGAPSGVVATIGSQFYGTNWNGAYTGLPTPFKLLTIAAPVWTVFVAGSAKRTVDGTAPPTVGDWLVGDQVRNTAPTATGYAGWMCVTAGTPGTWRGFGLALGTAAGTAAAGDDPRIVGAAAVGATMGTPTASASLGTVTSGATETRDAVLGNYVFTAVAGVRYRAVVDGLTAYATTPGDWLGFKIRNGGASTPTTASPEVAAISWNLAAGGYTPISLAYTFVPGAGVVTLGLFTLRVTGTGTAQPGSGRQLYATNVGPA